MPSAFDAARRMIAGMLEGRSAEEIARQSRPDTTTPLKPWIRPAKRLEPTFTAANWKTLLANSGAKEADKAELYDLKADPAQEKDLAAERPEVATALQGQLRRLTAGAGRAGSGPDAAQLEQLRSLGYVQ